MPNISDIIEQFILEQLNEFDELNLSRNDLADYFNVAPSQINYVLSTRFTYPRGFVTESRRGGGGYIKLTRLNLSDGEIVNLINNTLSNPIDYVSAVQLVKYLTERNLLSEREAVIIKSAISDKSLKTPVNNQDIMRANILRNILINILKED